MPQLQLASTKTNPLFWDCECESNYIHSHLIMKCLKCEALQEDQPDSIQSEIDSLDEEQKLRIQKENIFHSTIF